jgi:hypothetical protein
MRKTRERRPGQGAALDGQTPKKKNSRVANIAETRRRPQPLGMRTFWIEAGGLVTCTIIRRSDRQLWLAASVLHDKTATPFEYALKDWIAHAADHRPVCLSCDVTFSPCSLPTDWAMLSPLQESPTMPAAMLSGICAQCSGKSDRELMDAALHDLQATMPDIRRIEISTEAGRA